MFVLFLFVFVFAVGVHWPPRWPKMMPSWPLIGPTWPKMVQTWLQESPMKAPRKPQDSPQRRQVGPKSHPREPNKAPSGPEAGGSQMAWRRLASQGPKFRDAPSETHVVQGGWGVEAGNRAPGEGIQGRGNRLTEPSHSLVAPMGAGGYVYMRTRVCVCVCVYRGLSMHPTPKASIVGCCGRGRARRSDASRRVRFCFSV